MGACRGVISFPCAPPRGPLSEWPSCVYCSASSPALARTGSSEQVYGNPVFHIGSRLGILFVVVRVDGVRRRTSLYFGPAAPRVDARIALELARTPQTRGCAGRRRFQPLRIWQGDEIQEALAPPWRTNVPGSVRAFSLPRAMTRRMTIRHSAAQRQRLSDSQSARRSRHSRSRWETERRSRGTYAARLQG